jgi:hypothetical protein
MLYLIMYMMPRHLAVNLNHKVNPFYFTSKDPNHCHKNIWHSFVSNFLGIEYKE